MFAFIITGRELACPHLSANQIYPHSIFLQSNNVGTKFQNFNSSVDYEYLITVVSKLLYTFFFYLVCSDNFISKIVKKKNSVIRGQH